MVSLDEAGRRALTRLQPTKSGWLTAAATVVAVAIALGLSCVLIASTGGSPAASIRALWDGSVANSSAWSATLLNTAPLLLVAVGACVSARSGTFNIGQEGQVLVGALAGAWVGLRLALHGPLLLIVVMIASAIGGGVWAGLSALMYRFRGVNVVVSTLLMTFVAQQLITYAVSTSWFLQESAVGSSGIANNESNPIPANGQLNTIGQYPNLQLNSGLFLAVVATLIVAFVLVRSRWGFRLKLLGLNPLAARHSGVRVAALGGLALAISGAFAGLAGGVLLASPIGSNRLQPGISDNIGWDGLLVALVARNRPLVSVPVALLFGILRAGGDFLAATGIPYYLVDVAKSLLVLAFVAPGVLVGMLERRRLAGRVAPPAARNPLPVKQEVTV